MGDEVQLNVAAAIVVVFRAWHGFLVLVLRIVMVWLVRGPV